MEKKGTEKPGLVRGDIDQNQSNGGNGENCTYIFVLKTDMIRYLIDVN